MRVTYRTGSKTGRSRENTAIQGNVHARTRFEKPHLNCFKTGPAITGANPSSVSLQGATVFIKSNDVSMSISLIKIQLHDSREKK